MELLSLTTSYDKSYLYPWWISLKYFYKTIWKLFQTSFDWLNFQISKFRVQHSLKYFIENLTLFSWSRSFALTLVYLKTLFAINVTIAAYWKTFVPTQFSRFQPNFCHMVIIALCILHTFSYFPVLSVRNI